MQPITARRTRRILVILSIFGGAWRITLTSARSQTKWVPTPGGLSMIRDRADLGFLLREGLRSTARPSKLSFSERMSDSQMGSASTGRNWGWEGYRIGSAPPALTSRRRSWAQHTWHRCLARSSKGFSKTVSASSSIATQSRETLRADGGKEWPQIKAHERGKLHSHGSGSLAANTAARSASRMPTSAGPSELRAQFQGR